MVTGRQAVAAFGLLWVVPRPRKLSVDVALGRRGLPAFEDHVPDAPQARGARL